MTLDFDLHPYDGVDRVFRHDDTDAELRARGLALVQWFLRLPEAPAPDGLRYELSFYSGGMGIIDRLHMTLPGGPELTRAIASSLGMTPLAQLLSDSDLLNLIGAEDDAGEEATRGALVEFINDERGPFQPAIAELELAFAEPGSGVNHWTLLYYHERWVSYLGFDQG